MNSSSSNYSPDRRQSNPQSGSGGCHVGDKNKEEKNACVSHQHRHGLLASRWTPPVATQQPQQQQLKLPPELLQQKKDTIIEHAQPNNSGGDVILNLEDSYFVKSPTIHIGNGSRPDDNTTTSRPRQQQHVNQSKSTPHHHSNTESVTAAKNPETTISIKEGYAEEDSEVAEDEEVVVRMMKESKREESMREKTEKEFEEELKRALAESMEVASPQHKGGKHASTKTDVIVLDDSDHEGKDVKPPARRVEGNNVSEEDAQINEAIRLSLTHRKLGRIEFEEAIDAFVNDNGGYQKIESGGLIKSGNANDMKRSDVADGGGKRQTGAQYGRYTIPGMWRLFDVLEGKADVNIEDGGVGVEDGGSISYGRKSPANFHGRKSPPAKESKRKLEEDDRLEGLAGAEVKAFVDIGSGLGIQNLQAGWSLGIPSRGVEIMKPRHYVAQALREGVLESLRRDPPDDTLVDLKLADFSAAVTYDEQNGQRDEELRTWLLFEDRPVETQKGLVIFVNNAEEVFAARSNQNAKGVCLDAYLARLFGNMQIGGRMVTLTDVSGHLTQSTEWFQRDVFQSGPKAVSWGKDSIPVHVLTKLSNVWYCQNPKCSYKNHNHEACANAVVDVATGELCETCAFCDAPARKCSRWRKPSKKRKGDD